MNLNKTAIETVKKDIWFCGCSKMADSFGGFQSWENQVGHSIYFNKSKLRNEYVCVVHKKVKLENFEILEENQ